MNKPTIDYEKVARFYAAGHTIATIAELFAVSTGTIEYALRVKRVQRDRLDNPMKHSQSFKAIESRYYRYQDELAEALEIGDKEAIRRASEKVARERKALAEARKTRRSADQMEED